MKIGHGSNRYMYEQDIVADFSSNVAPGDVHPAIKYYLTHQTESLTSYPDPEALALRKALAKNHQVDAQNILVCNGATEAFYLLAHKFSGKRSIIPYPSFAEYADAAQLYQHQISEIQLENFWQTQNMDQEVIWLANPNNPTGTKLPSEKLQQFLQQHPSSFVILDEAYIDFCSSLQTAIPLIEKYPNLVVVRSLTKTFRIPGLRLGYIVASANVIDKLYQLQIPWSVNSLAQSVGLFIMENYKSLTPNLEQLNAWATTFKKQLQQFPEITVTESSCQFFLCKLHIGKAKDLKAYLVEQHGILIRDASNFKGLDERYFRVSTQMPEVNELLINALHTYFCEISIQKSKSQLSPL